jgi:hypothetical protein
VRADLGDDAMEDLAEGIGEQLTPIYVCVTVAAASWFPPEFRPPASY